MGYMTVKTLLKNLSEILEVDTKDIILKNPEETDMEKATEDISTIENYLRTIRNLETEHIQMKIQKRLMVLLLYGYDRTDDTVLCKSPMYGEFLSLSLSSCISFFIFFSWIMFLIASFR